MLIKVRDKKGAANLMTKSKDEAAKREDNIVSPQEGATLSSLEEIILKMRFGLKSAADSQPKDREVNETLRKKLQFLELKAFEQSGRIKELIGEIEKKTPKS